MNAAFHSPPHRAIVLAAGGTGGHLFPAQALAEELVRRGRVIHLVTDERAKDYGHDFPALAVHHIQSATLSLSKPWLVPRQALRLAKGYRAARETLEHLKPAAVAGFGGYPSLPPILAAARLNIPTLIHEQNAVAGRANRLLARFADGIASSFPDLMQVPAAAKGRVVFTGNPVRNIVLAERAAVYHAPAADEQFRLLVFGGSQGARFFADFMPQAMKALPRAMIRLLKVTQQCRAEDLERVEAAYKGLDLACELKPFFADMPQRIASAHLVLCRSGASTIAELGVIGRPAVMVPLPHALDNDQLRNAESFAKAGAGWVRKQAELKPEEFSAFLTRLRYQEEDLKLAARAALAHGRPDAASRLADMVERIAAEGAQPELQA